MPASPSHIAIRTVCPRALDNTSAQSADALRGVAPTEPGAPAAADMAAADGAVDEGVTDEAGVVGVAGPQPTDMDNNESVTTAAIAATILAAGELLRRIVQRHAASVRSTRATSRATKRATKRATSRAKE
jgi:hypothetical protein